MDQSPWPLRDLRITTPGLELRFPNEDDLAALAEYAALEDYDPSVPAFAVREDTPARRARRFLQRVWIEWGEWKPEQWILNLAVVVDGQTVGHQLAWAKDFGVVREVETGSWIAKSLQGRGYGKRMRAAMLRFAFDGIGAESAISAARMDKAASLAVSRRLGYAEDGLLRAARNGEAATLQRFRMDRATFDAQNFPPVEIHGLEPCKELFGL